MPLVSEEVEEGCAAAARSSSPVDDRRWIFGEAAEAAAATLQCCWRHCRASAESTDALRAHFDLHLDHVRRSGETQCGVVGCDFAAASADHLRGHLCFHIFHADRLLRGVQRLHDKCSSAAGCFRDSTTQPNQLHFDGGQIACGWDGCDRVFGEMLLYVEHVSAHVTALDETDRVKKKGYVCKWSGCAQTCATKSALRTHVQFHSGDKQMACPFCGKFFSNATKLLDHVIRGADDMSKRLKCFYCQKTFATQRLLREHSRRHIKRYKCDFCDMTVDSPSDLHHHIKNRHTTFKEYSCSVCSRGFHFEADMQRHMAAHSAENSFTCRYCPKSFKWQRWLASHEKLHTETRELYTYVCHLCPKRKYRYGSTLSRHLVAAHHMSLPSGHTRFQYKKCADGYSRLQTERYETRQLKRAAPAVVLVCAAAQTAPSQQAASSMLQLLPAVVQVPPATEQVDQFV